MNAKKICDGNDKELLLSKIDSMKDECDGLWLKARNLRNELSYIKSPYHDKFQKVMNNLDSTISELEAIYTMLM